jgi:hypothetical protein
LAHISRIRLPPDRFVAEHEMLRSQDTGLRNLPLKGFAQN